MAITYNLTTNFLDKDSLPENDPAKVIRGSEFQTEFLSIKSAFSSAAPTASPTFTGTSTFDAVNATTLTGNLTGDVTGNVTGNLTGDVTGNLTGDVTGTVLTAAQTNITSVGTLSSLNVSGDLAVNTDTLFVDGSSGNVGIGTTDTNGGKLVVGSVVSGDTSLIQLLRTGVTERTNYIGLSDSDSLVIAADENNEGTDSNIRFKVDGTERLRIDSSGRVGIGTSSPQEGLHLAGSFNTLRLDNNTDYWNIQGGNNLAIDRNGTERLRIDSSGNVGIGTSSPATKLHVNEATTAACEIRLQNTEGLAKLRTDSNVITIDANQHLFRTETGTERVRIDSSGNVGIGTSTPDNKFHVVAGAEGEVAQFTGAVENRGLALRVETSADASALSVLNAQSGGSQGKLAIETDGTERMRIDSSGNLLVGTTTGSNRLKVAHDTANTAVVSVIHSSTTASQVYGIDIDFNQANPNNTTNFFVRGQDASATEFHIWSDGSFVQASDRRLKDNIVDAPDALETVNAMRVRSFDKGENHHTHGFVAQELHEVYPEVVVEPDPKDEKGTWGVNYPRMVCILTKSIQEQQAIIEELRDRVAQLESGV